ncbi:MAG: ankyrin repeat domain-containing protein [Hyphomicrobiales bacterium]|nr:ankyrin repeat domain-containing protein [Hyphomicrobiales bacterium]
MMVANALISAVENDDLEDVQRLLGEDMPVNLRTDNGSTPLLIAAGHGNGDMVRLLLEAGADPMVVDRRGGVTPLHKACQGGNVEVARMLVEAGVFVDSVSPMTGHTPLMDALWFKFPDIVAYLLQQGAGLNLYTHYGFSLAQHFQYELSVNIIGRDLLERAEVHLNQRRADDEAAQRRQQLMAAVNGGNAGDVQRLIAAGADIEARYPRVNGFNDGHTPLLVAARDGHAEIVDRLLAAGANVNAVEPVFGAVPLHKAVYNGHAEITRALATHPGVDLDYQGATNGYTALHDSLWHGYADCAEVLVSAGARLDLRGDDGKTPLDVAHDTFGADSPVIGLLRSHDAPSAMTSV